MQRRSHRRGLRPAPSVKTISRSCAVVQLEGHLDRGARIEGAAHAAGERRPPHRRRLRQRAVAADELGAVAGHAAARIVHVEERRAAGELGVVGVRGDDGAGVGIDASVTTCGAAFAAEVAEHPLHVAGDRQTARDRPEVLRIFSTDHFTGAVGVHVHPQLRRRCRPRRARTRCSRTRAGSCTALPLPAGSGVGDQKRPLSSSRR